MMMIMMMMMSAVDKPVECMQRDQLNCTAVTHSLKMSQEPEEIAILAAGCAAGLTGAVLCRNNAADLFIIRLLRSFGSAPGPEPHLLPSVLV